MVQFRVKVPDERFTATAERSTPEDGTGGRDG